MTMKAPEAYEQLEVQLKDKGLSDLLQKMKQAIETQSAKESVPVVKRITKSKTQLYFAEIVERRLAGDEASDGTGLYGLAADIADALKAPKAKPKAKVASLAEDFKAMTDKVYERLKELEGSE